MLLTVNDINIICKATTHVVFTPSSVAVYPVGYICFFTRPAFLSVLSSKNMPTSSSYFFKTFIGAGHAANTYRHCARVKLVLKTPHVTVCI